MDKEYCRISTKIVEKALWLLLVCPLHIAAGAGTLDTTFNPSGTPPGTVTTGIGIIFAQGKAVAIQQDGKIVVAGQAAIDDNNFAVVRYNTDGSLDTTFNGTGIVTTDLGFFADGKAVAIQQDGKIVVAGFVTGLTSTEFAVVRYNTDGSLDTASFNPGGSIPGTVTTPIGSGNNAEAHAVVIQQDGKIVVGGFASDAGTDKFALARYNTDGSLDSATFNSGGLQPGTVMTLVGTLSRIEGMALQTDGKIIVTGITDTLGFKFVTARYNTDGSLDTTTFNSGGTFPGAIITAIGAFAQSFSVALQPNGQIVAAGYALTGTNVFALARYNADGTINSAFGTGGIVTTPIGTSAQGHGVAIQQDDKIVVAGFAEVAGSDQFAVALYNTDGSLDTNFSSTGTPPGTVTTAIDDSAQGLGVALQQDGKIVVAGFAVDGSINRFAAARYFSTFTPTPPIPPVPVNECALRLINKYGPRLL